VQAQRLGDLVADGVQRVQRRHRLLEDHADAVAAQRAQAASSSVGQLLAVEADRPADLARRRAAGPSAPAR
jgi:hypothetical protein